MTSRTPGNQRAHALSEPAPAAHPLRAPGWRIVRDTSRLPRRAANFHIRTAGLLLYGVLATGCASVAAESEGRELTHIVVPDPMAPQVLGLVQVSETADADGESTFSDSQRQILTNAIQQADIIISDTLFQRVIQQLEQNHGVEWTSEKSRLLPPHIGMAFGSWMRGRFATEGNYSIDEVRARTRISRTTAWTTACKWDNDSCALRTTLNTRFVTPERSIHAIMNTLIHERVHSFGMEHGKSQYRADNLCDEAYVYGDVAEALVRHRAEGAAVTPRQRLCPAVQQHLIQMGVVKGG